MIGIPNSEVLKPNQMCSVSECEQAIRAIARETGKSSLDIWRANEKGINCYLRMKDNKYEVRWPGWVFLISVFVIICGLLAYEYMKYGLGGKSLALVYCLLGCLSCIVSCANVSLAPRIGKLLRDLIGVTFSVFLALFGIIATNEVGDISLLRSCLFAIAMLSLIAGFHYLIFEWPWKLNQRNREEVRARLVTLRSTLPFVLEQDAVSVGSARASLRRRDRWVRRRLLSQ